MTLKHRIIPVLLFDETLQAVKPVAFERPYRRLGTLMQYIRVLERRNIDELILIDITATEQKREPNYDKIREFTSECYMPVTYGGGISSLDHISKLLNSGADKVAIKTNNKLIYEASRKFGSQAIVYSLDVIPCTLVNDAINYAESAKNNGAGEILVNKTNYDGHMRGYDLMPVKFIAREVKIPVIALGGCGEPAHMAHALKAGASAIAAGSMFLYTEVTPRDCVVYLKEQGFEVRLDEQNNTT